MVVGRHIEGRGHDLALNGALHIGDLFRTLVDEQADEVHLGVVDRDGLADLLKDRCLAGLGRRHDQATLALADRRHDIDGATGNGILAVLHTQRLVGIDRGEVAELGAVANLLGIHAVNGRDLSEAGALVAAARGAQRALDDIARAQTRGADEVSGDKGVLVGLHVTVGVDDTGAVRANLQDALNIAEALCLRGGRVDLLDKLGLLLAGRFDLELFCLLAQLGDLHGRKLLARKRGLGGGGIALFVALLAVALTTAAVVVAIVLAVAALVVALVLTAVGAGALFGLDAPVGRGCGCIGAGRSLALCLAVGVGTVAGFGVALLLGNLGLCGLLARTLGLISCRLVDVLGLGRGIGGCLGGLVVDGLGLGVGLRLL